MSDFDDTTTYEDPAFEDPSAYDASGAGVVLDSDGDGINDSYAEDLDGDGYIDTVEYDTDGDGVTDTIAYDTNADGITDTVLFGDGTGAQYVIADTDGDGIVDTAVADTDGDGIIDESETLADGASGDDPTTTTDPETTVNVDPTDPAAEISGQPDDGPFVTDDQPDAGDDGVHGDPRGDMQYHQTQPGPVDCLPTSVAMAINEATGSDVDAADVVQMANDLGFMGEAGMSVDNAATLFENYGMDAEVGTGTVDDLRAALDAGDPVVVGIDAADLYSGDGGPFDQGMVSGHAVVITGIDDGPPTMIYINDPGFPDGAGLEIPLDQFEDAWDDSDHALVTATAEGEDVGGVGADTSTDAGDGGSDTDGGVLDTVRRVLFLPLNFKVVR
ncbi:MAG: C39 family peptidase [Acidimicrobiales bacterium]|nr:C39 family peptidase [Acidimicrobiales bacterium]